MKPEEERSAECLLTAELAAVKAQIRALRARETALVRALTGGAGHLPSPAGAPCPQNVIALTRARAAQSGDIRQPA